MTDIQTDEADVASWRRLLHREPPRGSAELDADDALRLDQYLEALKSNPPGAANETAAADGDVSIQFPGPPMPNETLGRLGDYDILEELGSGAFGTVFRAFDQKLSREVAIKVLNPDHAAVHRDRQRFHQEAQVVSSLQHDHIVRIYDVCTASDFPLPYLVMELVDGQTLAEQLSVHPEGTREGMVDPMKAASLVRQVALALAAAHERGLVHRDVKPSNIVLERRTGRAKVTDFGLARQMFPPSELSRSEGTQSGRVIGTLPYMSPEQVLTPERVDARSDLYSLGVVLYELLTGERPFRGTTSALLVQVVHDEPQSLRRLNPGVPRDLETICLKCLQKEPARRYASAAALADELARFMAGEPILARPVPLWERAVKWVRRKPTIAALLAAVVVVTALGFGGVTWQWGRAAEGRAEARAALVDAEHARDAERALRHHVEKNLYFQRVARAHLEWLNNNLARADQLLDECPEPHRGWEWRYLRRLFHPEMATLRGHALEARRVAFSPDGKRIASTDALWNGRDPGTVIVWDAHTGQEQRSFVARSGGFFGVAFSPDGKRLAAANVVQGISVWDLATGREELKLSNVGSIDVAFDPTGQLVAGGDLVGAVRIWDARTGALRHKLNGPNGNVFSIAFSPDGNLLASTARDGTGRIWDVHSGHQVHLLRRIDGRCVAFSPDGRYLASCGYAGVDAGVVKVWKVGDEWDEILVQRVHDGPVTSIAISPDGRFLALNTASQAVVRLWDIETGRERRLLRVHPPAHGLAFSPDGRTLASCGTDGTVKLWDMTQELTTILRPDGSYVSGLAFRPDTRLLAFAGGFNNATRRGTKSVQIWDVTDPYHFSLEETLEGHDEWLTSVAYSGDGTRLATADRGGAVRIWDAASRRNVLILEGPKCQVTSVAFSPDGDRLVSTGTDRCVRVWDSRTGQPIQSLEGHEGAVRQAAFSPDGRLIASAGDDHTARLWDPATGQRLQTLRGHTATVRGLAFDSQGGLLATSGEDGLVQLWDLRATNTSINASRVSERPLRTFRGHTAAVTAVSFHSDGTRLASVSEDATVKLWDIDTGYEALTLAHGSGQASSVVFSSDGDVLAAARRRYVTLWDASDVSSVARDLRGASALRRARNWHERQIAACRAEKHWFGEVLHLSQLIGLCPDQPQYFYRRANTYALWARFADGGRGRELVEKSLADARKAIALGGEQILRRKNGD